MASTTIEGADRILARTLEELKNNTQITRVTPGAKARTMMAIVSEEIERLEENISSNIVLSLVTGASGIYLDFLGEIVGVRRNQRLAAKVLQSDQSIKITVEGGGVFGTVNDGRRLVIPPGTQVTSTDGSLRYVLLGRTELAPNDSEVFVGARAQKIGTVGNVAKGALTKLAFENYATFPNLKLKAENLTSIESGIDVETDDFYRFRITNALLSAETGNSTAIRLAALNVQSVADVVVLPLYRGIGTADIILDTATGQVSPVTLESVYRSIYSVQSIGMDIGVRAPRLVGLEVAADVKLERGLSSGDKKQVLANARQSVVNLLPNIFLGGELNINMIAGAITRSDKRIVDIGLPQQPLTEVILWRDSILSGGRRPTLTTNSNIVLAVDERLVLEGSTVQAIRISER